MLAAANWIGVDARQPEQRGHCALDPVAQRLGFIVPTELRRLKAADDADRQARIGAGSVNREVRRVLQGTDALRAFLPLGEAIPPQLRLARRELLGRLPLAPRV